MPASYPTALMIAIAFVGSSACRTLHGVDASASNPTVAYLRGAELQAEEAQVSNVCQALQDLATLARRSLQRARYADYQGKTGSWDLPTLLRAHFVPRSPSRSLPEGEAFWASVEAPGVRAVARDLYAQYGCPVTSDVRSDR